MVLAYAGLFAALALVGLACWKWPVGAERWYAYKYEKTQKAEYRGKLEKLGQDRPELLLSRWFFLAGSEQTAPHVADLPLRVRQRALTVAAWITVPLALAAERQAEDQKPRLVKVVFERTLAPEVLERYELIGANTYLDKEPTAAEIFKEAQECAKDEKVVRMALYFDPQENRYFWKSKLLGKDRIREAERDKWREYARKKLAIGAVPKGFTFDRNQGGCEKRYFVRYGDAEAAFLCENYHGPHDEAVDVLLIEVQGQGASEHDFIRSLVAEPEVKVV